MGGMKMQNDEGKRFVCSYNGIRFFGKTEEEAIRKRDEYIEAREQTKPRDDAGCQNKNAST